ncbi:PREDICTED: ewing's tumor-associated antigen 1 [Nanorana parkeri]|uniref:ewing's tumor-associated antigen 1 n=1 Tax=Nanorana parkeri TaxID=125878 RepID=UPI00085460D9|nr:PREDICTED: ewing's tumor-associated antigen 1 [Nanorana parkeri]
MASRKRQVAEKARRTCEEERKELGSPNRENPGNSRSKKLSRGPKVVAACLSSPASTPVASRKEKEGENGSNKKTPQLLSKCKSWDINSPSRDAEQHHEIFWDPNSPTCFKLDNGRKKTASKCIVEISDIVNRIAPKDGKPSNSDSSYFGVWIGDDAIPCTPVVTRTRTKMHRSRILKTEEELMELAKQLDRNLVEHKDQNSDDLIDKANKVVNVGGAQEDGSGSFLEYIPEEDEVSLALKSVSQSSGIGAEKSSQKSVDQEAEEAFNALFDCSTQKCSGRLSQTLSHVSTSSIEFALDTGNGIGENQLLTKHKVPPESNKTSGRFSFNSKVRSDMLQCDQTSKQAGSSGKEPVQSSDMAHSELNSQDDFEDDWGEDILEDDSFVMQITQNPELVATPKSNVTSKTANDANLHTVGGKDSSGCTAKVITSNKPNHFKFVPLKLNEGEGSKMKTPDLNRSETSHVKRTADCTRDRMISTAHALGPSGAQVPKPNDTGLNSSTNPSANFGVSKTYTFSSKPLSSRKEKDEIPKKEVQAAQQTHTVSKNKESVYSDEWDDPKFSDEVLEMFCESEGSLWEDKADDDDDLLYQVCDDVERLTQVQASVGNTQVSSSSLNVFTKSVTNNKSETKITTNYSCASNKSSGYTLSSNKMAAKGVSPASVSGNCLNSFQNSSFQRTNQASSTFSRSNSMPYVAESKKYQEPHSQGVNNLQATASNARTSQAPSKYSFTRTKLSPALSVHTNSSLSEKESISKGLQGFVDGNKRNPNLQPHVLSSQQSSLKRHLSESTIQSSKVFVSEDRSKKCSMEEIERKKQEALARKKMRERVGSNDNAPT